MKKPIIPLLVFALIAIGVFWTFYAFIAGNSRGWNRDMIGGEDELQENGEDKQQEEAGPESGLEGPGREETPQNGWEDLPPPKEPLRFIAVGDILLGRNVGYTAEKQSTRYFYPFEQVAYSFRSADIVFGNLEAPITASDKGLTGINEGGKYVLKSSPESVNGLKFAGFNILSLANNHILDYYHQGLFDTMDILSSNGILFAGAGRNLEEAVRPVIMDKKGVSIGFLAYTEMADIIYKGKPPLKFAAGEEEAGVAPLRRNDPEPIIDAVRDLSKKVDIVVVSLHWGVEYVFAPERWQVELAHRLIDEGADVIIGHHPHRCQGMEIYKGKPIFYSLGNFLFDQNNPLNQQSFYVDMEFVDGGLTKLAAVPFKIEGKVRIVPQKGQEALEMLERQKELSEALGSSCEIEGDRLVFRLQEGKTE